MITGSVTTWRLNRTMSVTQRAVTRFTWQFWTCPMGSTCTATLWMIKRPSTEKKSQFKMRMAASTMLLGFFEFLIKATWAQNLVLERPISRLLPRWKSIVSELNLTVSMVKSSQNHRTQWRRQKQRTSHRFCRIIWFTRYCWIKRRHNRATPHSCQYQTRRSWITCTRSQFVMIPWRYRPHTGKNKQTTATTFLA